MIDPIDGRPLWPLEEGDSLVPGIRALERLGVGHRCETWLAWSTELWHPVVVKLARPDQRDHPRAARSLRREVAAFGPAAHPALPRLHHDGTDADPPYVVVEYVDGPTLTETVDDEGALAPDQVALLGTQVLTALMALHRHGLAHLDLKPENVVLRDGRPVLIDGGSARQLDSPQPAGHPVGTPGYASPEMEACEPVSAAMDLFGLGATLAEALTGIPFEQAPVVPDGPVGTLLRRLLATDPSARGTCAEALVALADLAGDDRPWPVWADAELSGASIGA